MLKWQDSGKAKKKKNTNQGGSPNSNQEKEEDLNQDLNIFVQLDLIRNIRVNPRDHTN